MKIFEALSQRISGIVIDKISSRQEEGTSFGQRLDEIQNTIRELDLHKEFKGKGKEIAEEIRSELSSSGTQCQQINIIGKIPGGPIIAGGFLDLENSHKLTVLINLLVDFYFTLIGKAQAFKKASDNVDQIPSLQQEMQTVDSDPEAFGTTTRDLYNLLMQDPVIQHDMNRLLYEGDNLQNLNIQRIKKIMLQAIENSGITKVAAAYRDQYTTIASYIMDLAKATKTYVISPIIKTLKGPDEIANFFATKLQELLSKKQRALKKSLSQ